MKKKSFVIIIIVILAIIVSFVLICFIIRNKAEKDYQKGWAELYDESLTASYPLLKKEAEALYITACKFERNAELADNYSKNFEEFEEIFVQLNIEFANTQDGQYEHYWSSAYYDFIPSIPYWRLTVGSDLRKNETKAFWKIEGARQGLREWREYDNIQDYIKYCQNVKVELMEAVRDLDKYKSFSADENSWRKIGPEKASKLHQEYYNKKNWPFNYK